MSLLALTLGCTDPAAPGTQNNRPEQLDDTSALIDSEPDEVDDNPNLPEGVDDRVAGKACDLVGVEGTTVVAANSRGEAGQSVFLPSDASAGEVLSIELPESGAGFVTIEIPDWMTTVRIFTDDLATYEIDGADDLTGLRKNGACPDERISDARWAFHEWGAYVIEFSEESPRTLWFVALKE